MKVHCPACDSEIPASGVNVGTDVALCPRCHEAFTLSAIVASEPDTNFDIDDPPRGAWYAEEFGGWRLGATTRSWGALFIVPFTCVWAGGSMTGIYGTQIIKGEFSLFQSLFGIPFLLGSIALVSASMMSLFGKVVVTVDQGMGSVFTGVGPLGWTRRFDWTAVTRVEKDQWTNSNNNRPVISLVGKDRLKFGSVLNEARRDYLLQALRTLLAQRGEQS